jgi:hypothetical protein
MILPEEVINHYNFELQNTKIDALKEHLIHHYNSLTLKKYKETGEFYSKDEIVDSLPPKIVEWFYYTKKDKKQVFWAENDFYLEKFKTFIHSKYIQTDECQLKFKDLMISFGKLCQMDIPYTWSSKYAILCKNLDIKYEKVIDPRYANSTGTYHVNLKLK